jgi:hypothetical protein
VACGGVSILESSLGMKQGYPLRGPLFALPHYRALLKTIMRALSCVFPSLTDNTHIVGPMNEIDCTFHHLSIQLTLDGLGVKVSKCKLWSPSKISPCIKIPWGCTFDIYMTKRTRSSLLMW